MSINSLHDLKVRDHELDGLLMMRSLLRHGLDVSLYPRQVLISNDGDDEFSWVHGVPSGSRLGSVTFAQDKRIRRALMQRSEVPVTPGRTFRMGQGSSAPRRYAKKIGFPVVVKPAVGDNIIEAFTDLKDPEDLEQALDYLRTPTTERAGFLRSAYGLTELREPGEENGRIVVPPGYLYIVEKQLEGALVRFLVVDGEIRSVIKAKGTPADGFLSGGVDITGKTHEELKDLAKKAAASVSGLSVAAVDIVVEDPSSSLEKQEATVTDFTERPGLWVQERVDKALAHRLSDEMLEIYLKEHGQTIAEPQDSITVEFEAHAVPEPKVAGESLTQAAQDAGIEITITDIDNVQGIVYSKMRGDATEIAKLAQNLLDGLIDEHRVMLAEIRHTK